MERRRYFTKDEVEYMGLGDVVADVAKKLGFSECPGCKNRKAKLNKLVPRVKRKRRV